MTCGALAAVGERFKPVLGLKLLHDKIKINVIGLDVCKNNLSYSYFQE